ncbi:MAG: hypothetical protein U5K54_21810 [Cytophagales bacterium]|nr:hypothetical protein [Cytophagales bacterium]
MVYFYVGRLEPELEREYPWIGLNGMLIFSLTLNYLVIFLLEEKYVFPILGEHKLVKRAIADHRLLKRLFAAKTDLERNLVLIEEKLEDHIRFEERVLFPEIQKAGTADELKQICIVHRGDTITKDSWDDEFWK